MINGNVLAGHLVLNPDERVSAESRKWVGAVSQLVDQCRAFPSHAGWVKLCVEQNTI
jgi:hypothetical protein